MPFGYKEVSVSNLERDLILMSSEAGRSVKSARANQPSEHAPAVPNDMDWELPEKYKARRCRFCRCWSTDRCQWELKDTVLAAWRPLTPWARGTVEKQISDCCKVCSIVSWMVYVQTYVQKHNSLSLCHDVLFRLPRFGSKGDSKRSIWGTKRISSMLWRKIQL